MMFLGKVVGSFLCYSIVVVAAARLQSSAKPRLRYSPQSHVVQKGY